MQNHNRDLYTPPDDDVLPPYSTSTAQGLRNHADITSDGRVNIDTNSRIFQSLMSFVPDWKGPLPADPPQSGSSPSSHAPPEYIAQNGPGAPDYQDDPKSKRWNMSLNIVIQVVGSRGDVQPFIALGNVLQRWGHRVRIATHAVFETFVTSSNLEFYPIGGDPAELMAYMVKNAGLIPSIKDFRSGAEDIYKKRKMVTEILEGCWQSCIGPDLTSGKPFVAHAIIANPPSFAHVHCAQALGIPLHLMFTMPWTNTRMFSHPLANLKGSPKGDQQIVNYLSFTVVDFITWQGLADVINDWRATLDLEPVPMSEGPLLAKTLKIPFTYCWSPALVPKPADWPSHIDVCGFFFRDAPDYTPPEDLARFLRDGPPPVYIGFGSIVISDPEQVTQKILDAVRMVGTRAVISRGWSKIGGERTSGGDIFYIDDCPHEWLFQHVSAVVHHGGAGTTACGLRYGRPTTIVPFFGDQPFWGNMVAKSGAGPEPIPYKQLATESLAEALKFCLTPAAEIAARSIAVRMESESGVEAAAQSFHRHLPLEAMRCRILEDQPATWVYKSRGNKIQLSCLAVEILGDHLKIDTTKLKLHESNPVSIENRRWDPATGTASAMIATFSGMVGSTAGIVINPAMVYHRSRSSGKLKPSNSVPDLSIPPPSSASSHSPTTSPGTSIVHVPVGSDTHSIRSQDAQPRVGSRAGSVTRPSMARIAGAMALGAADGVGGTIASYSKGMFIDVPLAFSEGMRNAPRLYGGDVRDYGTVKGWKSGLVVGTKTLTYGIGEGVADLFVEPVKGAMKEGVWGGVKGTGKGVLGCATKWGTALFGTVAYPGLGFYKSIQRSKNSKARKSIMLARHLEGRYLLEKGVERTVEAMVLAAYEYGRLNQQIGVQDTM